LRSRVGALAFN